MTLFEQSPIHQIFDQPIIDLPLYIELIRHVSKHAMLQNIINIIQYLKG